MENDKEIFHNVPIIYSGGGWGVQNKSNADLLHLLRGEEESCACSLKSSQHRVETDPENIRQTAHVQSVDEPRVLTEVKRLTKLLGTGVDEV